MFFFRIGLMMILAGAHYNSLRIIINRTEVLIAVSNNEVFLAFDQ